MTPHELPAMVNAHSHAFQRDLRGAAERPAPEAHAADDFWSWREAMYALAGSARPGLDARGGRPRVRRDGRGRLRRGGRVPLRPPPAGRDAVRRSRTRWRSRVAEAARAAGLAIVLLPAAYHRAGWDGHDLPPSAGQRRFCDPDVEAYLERVDALRAWAAARDGVHGRRRRAQRPRGSRDLAGGDRRLRRRSTAWCATSTPTSSRASWRSAAPSTASPPIELLRPHRLPRPAHEPDPRRSTSAPATCAGWPRATRSSSPARRPRAASATATSRRSSTATRACGSRSAATRRCASTRSRRRASSRRSPAASAAPATPCSPRYGDLWGELAAQRPREPRPRGRRHDRDRPRPPRAARGRRRRHPAGGRDVRLGGGGLPPRVAPSGEFLGLRPSSSPLGDGERWSGVYVNGGIEGGGSGCRWRFAGPRQRRKPPPDPRAPCVHGVYRRQRRSTARIVAPTCVDRRSATLPGPSPSMPPLT